MIDSTTPPVTMHVPPPSGSADPRSTGYWADAVVAARTAVEDHTPLRGAASETVAEAAAERIIADILAEAEASSWLAFLPDGTGPVCTWCGLMAPFDRCRRQDPTAQTAA
jgi:hypothetical protein